MKDYLFTSGVDSAVNAQTAIVMLPDIYAQTSYAKATAQEFSKTFGLPVFMLDYFYTLTNKPNDFSADDQQIAHDLMDRLTGAQFVEFFNKALSEIQTEYKQLSNIIVVGFCFGGRLAYLTGLNKSVSKIVSFYGGGANEPGYYNDVSAIQALVAARTEDSGLEVLSFFGAEDQSIPEADRAQTLKELTEAKISCRAHEYQAGHAYFQPGRPNYNEQAAKESWQVLKDFLNEGENNGSN